jgi:ubiquinone/menaquinone biosynthesis C-methylase UbiE
MIEKTTASKPLTLPRPGEIHLTKKKINDRDYLLQEQYKQSNNLRARITLHERFSTNPIGWYSWLFNHYYFPPNARILEIGCGPGDMWESNQERVPGNWKLTLTDLSEGMVSKARQKLSTLPVQFCCVDADILPFLQDSFDAVIGNHMLYHVPDKDHTLKEIQRVLVSGGYLISSTNGDRHLSELYDIIKGFDPNYEAATQMGSFTLENGNAFLSKYFEKVERFDFPDSLKITEAEPLVEYTLSLWSINRAFFRENLAKYRAYLQDMLDANGSIDIKKSVGVFVSGSPRMR